MNKLKKIVYTFARNHAKNYITGNLGKVVEDDEKITCYVRRNKVKKKNYTIACFGIGKKQKEIAEAYKLNKPICYVIDGLELKKHNVYIFGYNNCEVVIKNCNFGFDVYICVNGKCTLDNTHITTYSFLSIGANELIIKNMNSDQIRVISSKGNIGFSANDRLDITDSNIGKKKEKNRFSFSATNELNIVNSKIIGDEIICKSDKIKTDKNSSLTAGKMIDLKTEDFDSINISSPTIVLNGNEIPNEKDSIVFRKITDSLTLKRLELVQLLKKIKNKCELVSSEKVEAYKSELSDKPISKVLKK